MEMDSVFSSCDSDTLESTSQHGSSEPRSQPLEYFRDITKNFTDVLGRGGFGTVYKGELPNGKMVAVKKLHSSVLPGVQDKQFENEAYHLTRLKHPNIVLLVSWCSETETIFVEDNGKKIWADKIERLLCLEYMPKGNLRQYLSGESSGLTWEIRYKIIEGICYGLHYLHDKSTPIIHMDLKPENILLDDKMMPKIADFGLSRLFSEQQTKVVTINCVGTLGYMAPEYIKRGIISTKSDIFSLGVIIIEIVTGERNYPDETGGISSHEFTELVLKNWRNRLQKSLEIDYHQIRRCIQIGLDCVEPDRSKRPTISNIIDMLQETERAVQNLPTLIDDNPGVLPNGETVAVKKLNSSMNSEFSSCDTLESMSQHGSSGPHNLPLEYLRNITNNFSDNWLIGEAGFGTIYKGVLPNGEMVAVKKLNSSMLPGVKDKQFENEAYHLMRLKHPNILLHIGWCSETENIYVECDGKIICTEKSERLLCFEYMPKGNLRWYLSDESSGLTWETRYKIIEGICFGLHYLHEESPLNAPIVHMDLKPASILLDNNMVPKIANFGLTRLFGEEDTESCTISHDGSLGYMAPEYITRGIISTMSDLFSLGVIIIEIVTGERDYPDETGGVSSHEFIELVLKNWRNRLQKSLEIDYQQIRRCIQIALDCVKLDQSKRPTISQVIKKLQETESAVQNHPTLIDDNQILSLGSHGFGGAPEVMPLELLRQSTNNFSEKQKLGSGTFGTVYKGVTKSFASFALSRRSSLVSTLTGLKEFSYGDIKRATKNFAEDKIIGQGGFGKVYKGMFNIDDNKKELAVKCCVTSPSVAKLLKDELKILAKLRHKNVVQLVGFCNNDGWFRRGRGLYICSEFISNGPLDKHIFASWGQSVIEWPIRYQIIRGICAGLLYLHEGHHIKISHMDLKPSNIMLDEEMVPKIGDFGLSRAFLNNRTHTYTRETRGSIGYMAPEFVYYGRASLACDIYSLGVLILAIVMGDGPRATIRDPSGVMFINKVRDKFVIDLKASTPKMICSAKDREQLKKDASLQYDDLIEDVEKCVGLAFECVNEDPRKRPTAADICTLLNQAISS